MSEEITIALTGNPNSGKTTLFNALTGARQHVGNYPGVTVEKKEGKCKYENTELNIVDLPGTYSLTAYSIEEIITRDFIINEKPDVIIDVVDASNLERNLYLATQLIELEIPLILALNMIDVANSRGYSINIELLSKLMDTPIITTVASKEEGIKGVITCALERIKNPEKSKEIVKYNKEIEKEINLLLNFINSKKIYISNYSPRWIAIKLLENDSEIIKLMEKKIENSFDLLEKAKHSRESLKNFFGEDPETIIADLRYGFVNGAYKETVKLTRDDRITFSEKLDSILTNRILGIPIFIVFMWIVFHLTFTLGNPPMELIEYLIELFGAKIASFMNEGVIKSLIIDGIIGGVGGVIIFLPNIVLLFLAISILEDTGYMARVAFIVDKLMHYMGLHGRSFIPMLIGFGCSVPAIMSARSLDNEKDRLTTIMVIPLMSCGAKLPVYTLLIGTFFSPEASGNVLFSIYIIGIIFAVILGRIFRKTLFKGETSHFIMELPPYRLPTIKSILIHMWERSWLYLQKAGTVILAFSILIWFLTNFPKNINSNEKKEFLSSSYAGKIGKFLEPAISPLGFDWKIGIALFSGFTAKEAIVSTLGTIYSSEVSNDHSINLKEILRKDKKFSPLVAYTLMIFILLYMPCIATVSTVYRETNSIIWPVFLVFYTISIAWIMSFFIYQGGKLLGLG